MSEHQPLAAGYPGDQLSFETDGMRRVLEAAGVTVLLDKAPINGWLYRCRLRGTGSGSITSTSTSSASGAVANAYRRWVRAREAVVS